MALSIKLEGIMLYVIVLMGNNGLPEEATGPIDSLEDAEMYATEIYGPSGTNSVWRVVNLYCPA